jgi:hypothetical protein
LRPVAREGLAMMTGLFWDLGAGETPSNLRRNAPAESEIS